MPNHCICTLWTLVIRTFILHIYIYCIFTLLWLCNYIHTFDMYVYLCIASWNILSINFVCMFCARVLLINKIRYTMDDAMSNKFGWQDDSDSQRYLSEVHLDAGSPPSTQQWNKMITGHSDVIHIAILLFQFVCLSGTAGPIITLRCLAGTVRFVSVIGGCCGYIIGQSRKSFIYIYIQSCCWWKTTTNYNSQ